MIRFQAAHSAVGPFNPLSAESLAELSLISARAHEPPLSPRSPRERAAITPRNSDARQVVDVISLALRRKAWPCTSRGLWSALL
jgi:hypothetical protein